MSDPLIYDCDNYVVLEPGKDEVILSAERTKKWLERKLSQLEEMPADLRKFKSISSSAQHLLDTACSIEIKSGITLQWFAVRLDPPGR